jgi:hypothetical protein
MLHTKPVGVGVSQHSQPFGNLTSKHANLFIILLLNFSMCHHDKWHLLQPGTPHVAGNTEQAVMQTTLTTCLADGIPLICILLPALQASADAATKAGDSCLASWEGATPPQQTAALADMWIELAAAVSSARLAAVQQARAAAAAQQAKAAAAEQARLESERQLDGVQHAAVAAAVAKYKKAMSELAQNSTSEAEVRFKHGVRRAAGLPPRAFAV